MALDTPLGYTTVDEVSAYLDVDLNGAEQLLVRTFIETAEGLAEHYSGNRRFVPVRTDQVTLLMEADDTTVEVNSEIVRFPEAGYLYYLSSADDADPEIMSYSGVTVDKTTGEPAEWDYTLQGLSRGLFGTTAVQHEQGDYLYLIKGFTDEDISVYPGDFLELHKVWWGDENNDTWSEINSSYYTVRPPSTLPKQVLELNRSTTNTVQIAATWGYSWSPPAAVKQACLRLVEEMWAKRGTMGNSVIQETVEGHSITFKNGGIVPNDVRDLLSDFRRVVV
jgi:hypothetical protein